MNQCPNVNASKVVTICDHLHELVAICYRFDCRLFCLVFFLCHKSSFFASKYTTKNALCQGFCEILYLIHTPNRPFHTSATSDKRDNRGKIVSLPRNIEENEESEN